MVQESTSPTVPALRGDHTAHAMYTHTHTRTHTPLTETPMQKYGYLQFCYVDVYSVLLRGCTAFHCLHRLVTITGNRESICKAFEAIGVKIEQVNVTWYTVLGGMEGWCDVGRVV